MRRRELIPSSSAPIIVLVTSALFAGHADADANLNCSAYATKAVEQQKQNTMLGCNFTGPGWQRCRLPNVQMADLVKEASGALS